MLWSLGKRMRHARLSVLIHVRLIPSAALTVRAPDSGGGAIGIGARL